MSRWRAMALELLPELKREAVEAESPYLLWFELGPALRAAYDPPFNESLIERIYQYADWCWDQRPAKEVDLRNCVAVSFYEHLADHAAVRADMPRWMDDRRFADLASLYQSRLGPDGFDQLKRERAEYTKQNPVLRTRPAKDNKRR